MFLELPNFFDSFWLLFSSCSALTPFPLLLLFCWFLDLGPTVVGRLGGRNGAREGAGIQWPIFPSFCLDEEREREKGRIVDFDGAEKSLVNFEGEEKSRACSVAGLG